jgi:hypothetical protein
MPEFVLDAPVSVDDLATYRLFDGAEFVPDNGPPVTVSAHTRDALYVILYNAGPNTAYLGPSTVTAATGRPLLSGASWAMGVGDFRRMVSQSHRIPNLYAICSAGQSAVVRVLRATERGGFSG